MVWCLEQVAQIACSHHHAVTGLQAWCAHAYTQHALRLYVHQITVCYIAALATDVELQ